MKKTATRFLFTFVLPPDPVYVTIFKNARLCRKIRRKGTRIDVLKNYSFHIRSTRRELALEYFLPLAAEIAILILCLIPFKLFTGLGPMIEEPSMVGEELTKPTAGRLVFGILVLILWLVFSIIASRAASKDKHYASSLFGFAAGIFLWQFIGEISWHFSVGGVHFVPFESVTTFPIACLFILLMIYGKRHHSFDWGIWCMLLSFAFNWMGHYVMEGTYPFAASFADQHTWYICASVISGVCGFIFSIIYLLFRVKTRRGRILASMMTYISVAVLAFGLMEG